MRPVLEPCEARSLLSGAGGHALPGALAAWRAPAQVRVGFQGQLQGSLVVTPISPTVQDTDLTVSGWATRPIGRFTGDGQSVMVASSSGSALVTGVVQGTGTITTADGSQIDYQGTGTFRAGRVPGSLQEDFRATITGGTGKWEGISGGFRVHLIVQNVAPGTALPLQGRFAGLLVRSRG
jgi:hypothetical protein